MGSWHAAVHGATNSDLVTEQQKQLLHLSSYNRSVKILYL